MSSMIDRPSDVIFNKLNRFYDAKLSGALTSEELSELIVLVGDLFANKIKQGKVSMGEIESAENFVDQFAGNHTNNYFNFKHNNLDKAAKIFLEGNYAALEQVERRNLLSQPVEENQIKGFQKVA